MKLEEDINSGAGFSTLSTAASGFPENFQWTFDLMAGLLGYKKRVDESRMQSMWDGLSSTEQKRVLSIRGSLSEDSGSTTSSKSHLSTPDTKPTSSNAGSGDSSEAGLSVKPDSTPSVLAATQTIIPSKKLSDFCHSRVLAEIINSNKSEPSETINEIKSKVLQFIAQNERQPSSASLADGVFSPSFIKETYASAVIPIGTDLPLRQRYISVIHFRSTV